jgi:hypothetical protein
LDSEHFIWEKPRRRGRRERKDEKKRKGKKKIRERGGFGG